MKLPVELRLIVYGHLLGSRNVLVLKKSSKAGGLKSKVIACTRDLPNDIAKSSMAALKRTQWQDGLLLPGKCISCHDHSLHRGPRLSPNILRVSKEVHQEAMDVLYSTNEFWFNDDHLFVAFLQKVPAQHLGNIRRLLIFYSIRSSLYIFRGKPWTLMKDASLIEQLSKLKRLHLVNVLPGNVFAMEHGTWTGEPVFRGQMTNNAPGRPFLDLLHFRCLELDEVEVTLEEPTSPHLGWHIPGLPRLGSDAYYRLCRLTPGDKEYYYQLIRKMVTG